MMVGKRSILWLGMMLVAVFALGTGATACYSAQAAYPTKAINLTVAFAAGGGTDLAARVMAKHLTSQLGVPVNIVNKPGGNQIPAVMAVLSARPDGYTLNVDGVPTTTMHAIIEDLPYKFGERTFIAKMVIGPLAYVVNGKSPWNSLKDVAEAAKKDPGSFTWGRLGGYSNTDFSQLQFLTVAGVDISKTKAVPFTGSGPAITAVAGGHVKFGNTGAAAVLPLLASGDLKVLAITSDKRVSSLPDVPTTKEAGFPELNLQSWFGLGGSKDLPKDVVAKLQSVAKNVTENQAYVQDLQGLGLESAYLSGDELRQQVMKDAETYKALAGKIK